MHTVESLRAFEADIAADGPRRSRHWRAIERRQKRRLADPAYAERLREYDRRYRERSKTPENIEKRRQQRAAKTVRDKLIPGKLEDQNRRYYQRHRETIRRRHDAWLANPKNRIRTLAIQRIGAAKKAGVEYDRNVLLALAENPPTHCPIFGVLLDYSLGRGHKNVAHSPTIDRVDASRGYVVGNVEVICHRANTVKNFGTAEEHQKIANYMRRARVSP